MAGGLGSPLVYIHMSVTFSIYALLYIAAYIHHCYSLKITSHKEDIVCSKDKLTGNDYWSFRLDGEVVGDYTTR